MKRALLGLAVLCVGGFLGWLYVLRSPESRACAHVADLCNDPAQQAKCDDYFAGVRKVSPDEVARQAACVRDAKSCSEALGCQLGGTLKMGTRLLDDFMKGMERSVGK